MSTKKGVQISPIPAFGGPLQIFWPSIIEARANFPNVLAKILWSFYRFRCGVDTNIIFFTSHRVFTSYRIVL
jgi:hypothetical protein